MAVTLKLRDQDVPAFVAYLTLGMLHAIRNEVVPASVGIATVGPPWFWEPLEKSHAIPRALLDVLQECDELDALKQLDPAAYQETIETLITRVQAELKQEAEPTWVAQWATPG